MMSKYYASIATSEKFQTLLKKIVNVPREEYEQEQKKYEATKSKDTWRGKVKAVS